MKLFYLHSQKTYDKSTYAFKAFIVRAHKEKHIYTCIYRKCVLFSLLN